MLHFSVRARTLFERIWAALSKYALSLLLVIVAVAVRSWLHPVMQQSGLAILFAAVVIAAWVGGVGPGLMSLAIAHVIDAYWFHTPSVALIEPNIASIVTVSAYYLVIATVGVLSQTRRSAQRRE